MNEEIQLPLWTGNLPPDRVRDPRGGPYGQEGIPAPVGEQGKHPPTKVSRPIQ